MSLGVNRAGHDWLLLRRYIDEEIASLHRLLENRQPEGDTYLLRGQITSLRKLVSEVEPEPTPPEAEEPDHYG